MSPPTPYTDAARLALTGPDPGLIGWQGADLHARGFLDAITQLPSEVLSGWLVEAGRLEQPSDWCGALYVTPNGTAHTSTPDVVPDSSRPLYVVREPS